MRIREIEKRCRAAQLLFFLSFFTVTNYHNPQKPADFSFPARFNLILQLAQANFSD